MSKEWTALAREAGLAAEHIAIGTTALGRANYAAPAYYAQALFALSIGFERSIKLALVVDHALDNAGEFPQNEQIRAYGHDLRKLMRQAEAVATKHGVAPSEACFPD